MGSLLKGCDLGVGFLDLAGSSSVTALHDRVFALLGLAPECYGNVWVASKYDMHI